jgi:hypothetical protein
MGGDFEGVCKRGQSYPPFINGDSLLIVLPKNLALHLFKSNSSPITRRDE